MTIIDSRNHHLFQPLLYQIATGIVSEGDIAPPIRGVLRRQRNAIVLIGDVERVDRRRGGRCVQPSASNTEVPYDSLIVAAGAHQSDFGHPEFERVRRA